MGRPGLGLSYLVWHLSGFLGGYLSSDLLQGFQSHKERKGGHRSGDPSCLEGSRCPLRDCPGREAKAPFKGQTTCWGQTFNSWGPRLGVGGIDFFGQLAGWESDFSLLHLRAASRPHPGPRGGGFSHLSRQTAGVGSTAVGGLEAKTP